LILRAWLTHGGRLRVAQPLLLALGPALLLLTVLAPYRWIYFMVYCFGLLALLCYGWARYQGPQVRVARRLRDDWAQVGDELKEQWELTNRSWLPLLWIELDDASEVPGYAARRVAACGPHSRQHWTTEAICTRRGVYSVGPLTLTLSDPFGVFEYRWRDPTVRRIVIYPPLVRLPPLRVPQGQRGGLARADLLQQYATPSVGGVREYRPGDTTSHIHWPTVARTGNLMVKEFDQERAGAVWIVLDLFGERYAVDSSRYSVDGRGGSRADPTVYRLPTTDNDPLELAVVLAASLAAQLLGEGRSVGLLADDGRARAVPPGQGPRQLWRILGELVDVEASGAQDLRAVLRRWRQSQDQGSIRGAALALVTPDSGAGWLSALAEATPRGGAMALLIDAGSFQAQPPQRAATELQASLAAMGVATYIFGSDAQLPQINPPRPKEEIRISPLGRAVRITPGH
jgi:uncharacterized protein (DUF58 family)